MQLPATPPGRRCWCRENHIVLEKPRSRCHRRVRHDSSARRQPVSASLHPPAGAADHFVHRRCDTRRVADSLQLSFRGQIRLVLSWRHAVARSFRRDVSIDLCFGDRGFPGLCKLFENEGVENFLARRRSAFAEISCQSICSGSNSTPAWPKCTHIGQAAL